MRGIGVGHKSHSGSEGQGTKDRVGVMVHCGSRFADGPMERNTCKRYCGN